MENVFQKKYEEKGYKNRLDYLINIANDYGVPFDVVRGMAFVLGTEEDFDGLIAALEDWED